MTILNLMKIVDSSPGGYQTLWVKEKLVIMCNFFFSPQTFQKTLIVDACKNQDLFGKGLTLSQTTNFTLSQTEILSQTTNFTLFQTESLQTTISNLMKMAEISPTGRKHCLKRRNCLLRAISPFPTVFSKGVHCRPVKTRACLGKGSWYSVRL